MVLVVAPSGSSGGSGADLVSGTHPLPYFLDSKSSCLSQLCSKQLTRAVPERFSNMRHRSNMLFLGSVACAVF